MEAETLDLIIRTRSTILDIVEGRGYDVSAYRGISPEELFTIIVSDLPALKIVVTKKDEGGNEKTLVVQYFVDAPIRLKLNDIEFMSRVFDAYDPSSEFIAILSEMPHDMFNIQAARLWSVKHMHMTFFNLKNLVSNPAKHVFVPPHRKLSAEETADVIAALHLKSKHELPHIKYHLDMQTRVHGFVPGDVIEIIRPSETCAEYKFYRVCVI
jgi:DNA-directed RNA polymerase subunit H (RpoH/RPB5)